MGNQNVDIGKGQGQEKVPNPGQNPNVKKPQQGQNQGRPSQQGFDKNRQQQKPGQYTGAANEEGQEEASEKEDLYGNRKNQGGNMDRPEKH